MKRKKNVPRNFLLLALLTGLFLAQEARAGISLVNYGTAVKVASGNMASVGVPSGIQNNDILIVVVHSRDNVDSSMPEGWTPVVEGNGNSTNRLEIWRKRTSGTESPPEVTHSGGDSAIAIMVAFRGAVTSGDPFDEVGSVQSNASSPISTTQISTNVDGAMILHAFGSEDNNNWGSYTGIPTEGTYQNNSSGSDNSVGLACRTFVLNI